MSPDTPLIEHVADMGDRTLDRVVGLANERGLPIRMRILIQFWDWTSYVGWKGQVWRIEVRDRGEAEGIRDAMEAFFDLVAMHGPREATKRVELMKAAPVGEGQEPAGASTNPHD